MHNFTIQARVLILGMIAVGSMVIASGVGIFELSRFNTQLRANLVDIRQGIGTLIDIQTAAVAFKTQVQEWKNILIRGNQEQEFSRYEKAFLEKEKVVQERLKTALGTLKTHPENAGLIADIEKLIQDHADLGSTYKTALGSFDKNDPQAGKKVDVAVKGRDRAATESIAKVVATFEKSETDHLEHQLIALEASLASSRRLLIALMAIALLLSGAVVVVTVRQISGQMAIVQETTAKIRESLDLSRRIPISGKSEMAQVASSVNSLLDEFQAVVRRMRDTGDHVAGASVELAQSVGHLAAATGQQNDATSSIAATVEEMSVSITHVANSSATAQEIARQALATAVNGGQVIEKTVCDMVAMAETVQSASHTLEGLGKRTDQIGSTAEVIKEIADQTNLLALNAAIEAARAGEQGRGFAVVADEVRKLAERTSSATSEIGGILQSIRTDTESAVAGMQAAAPVIASGVTQANSAADTLRAIEEQAQDTLQKMNALSQATHEQTHRIEEIVGHVDEVMNASEQTENVIKQSLQSAADLEQASSEMFSMVQRFNIGELDNPGQQAATRGSAAVKPLMAWSNALAVGHAEIDRQHQVLIEIANRLNNAMHVGAGRAACGSILDELVNYTVNHFGFEEKLMEKHRYPDREAHLAAHHKLIEEVSKFKRQYESGATIPIELMGFIRDWLVNHILKVDKELARDLKSRGLS